MSNTDPTNAERQRRWRQRRNAESDPVLKYLNGVMTWGEAHGTAGSGKLALAAAKMLEAAARGPRTEDHGPAEMMASAMIDWAPRSGRGVYSDAGRIAMVTLARAQAEMEAGTASERTVSAGLAMAKHLLTERPTSRDSEREASLALARALLGPDGGYAPAHLCEPPTDGPSAFLEDHDR